MRAAAHRLLYVFKDLKLVKHPVVILACDLSRSVTGLEVKWFWNMKYAIGARSKLMKKVVVFKPCAVVKLQIANEAAPIKFIPGGWEVANDIMTRMKMISTRCQMFCQAGFPVDSRMAVTGPIRKTIVNATGDPVAVMLVHGMFHHLQEIRRVAVICI